MSKLSLPIAPSALATLQRWGAELRRFNPLSREEFRPRPYAPAVRAETGTAQALNIRNAQFCAPSGSGICEVWYDLVFTLSGASTAVAYVTLPIPPAIESQSRGGTYRFFGAIAESGSEKVATVIAIPGALEVQMRREGSATINTGAVGLAAYLKYPIDE